MLGEYANTGRDNRTAYQIALAAVHIDSALLLQQAERGRGLKPQNTLIAKSI